MFEENEGNLKQRAYEYLTQVSGDKIELVEKLKEYLRVVVEDDDLYEYLEPCRIGVRS